MLIATAGAVRRIAAFLGLALAPAAFAQVVQQSTIEFMRAHERQFDDLPTTAVLNRMTALPAEARTTKVRAGRVGDSSALAPAIRAALDDAWQAELGAPLGVASYAELRARLRQLHGGHAIRS